ncbi:HNH endonuclease signature motif containing protein [Lentzea sp. BCCO 10_0061]|uniref:HNH endonuclease signature motif containing protein n=1 Tax=Lentzea sokolovensis TaxID=3095429 RepID=A0ABU4V6A5_9PSEU|nr:HNH endonuclease signature motif containing protein [Lentzea sp. BCCO 10_0061]MDX8146493.1 HNH endonuclease signature motif containing protein [Lentzea sp. BCCO 10_0061]
MGDTTAWLVLAAGDDRSRASNDGYDDFPSSHYSWDDKVPNHAGPQPGHVIVLRDKHRLLGASVIESIAEGTGEKATYRCGKCGSSKVEPRATVLPPIKCYSKGCGAEFDQLPPIVVDVVTYRTKHDVDWMDLYDRMSSKQLRELSLRPKSQHSIRELDYDRFRAAIDSVPAPTTLNRIEAAAKYLTSGHRKAYVRVRVGQEAFRGDLLLRYGNECAFTGSAPPAALEAAHLYSYAETGVHHADGGFLMRRDIHRLFDEGLLAVHPNTLHIDVHPNLAGYPEYARFHDKPLHPTPTEGQREWLRRHWEQMRPTSPAAA